MDPINTHIPSSLSAAAPLSASSSTATGHGSHGYPSPPATALDVSSESEDEGGRGRSKIALLSDPTAALDHHHIDPAASPDVVKSGRRQANSAAHKTNDGVPKLTAAEMQELAGSPDSLPVAPAPPRRSTEQEEMAAKSAEQHELLWQRIQSRFPDSRRLDQLQINGTAVESPPGSAFAGAWPRQEGTRGPYSQRTVSTPPTSRAQQYVSGSASQPTSPRRSSHNPLIRPAKLNLDGQAATGGYLNGHSPSPVLATSQAATSRQQPSADAAPCQGYSGIGPSPPSPIPSIIPLPPMSLPTHLQLELAVQRPSPLHIHRSHVNDMPYESYAVKVERLKNVLLLPSYLERTLYFGALACLDAWLYTFTILPMRFFIAFGVLTKWWGYVISKEVRWLFGYVRDGLGRLWKRGRASQSRRPSDVSDRDGSRSRSRVRELLNDEGGVCAAATAPRDRSRNTRTDLHVDSVELPKTCSFNHRHTVPKSGALGHKRAKSIPSSLSAFHKADLLQGAVIICSSFALMTLDASRMYHFIRAQSAIKLYVIYNILEVGDRLLSALGQDILECLFSNETLSRDPSGRSKILLPLGMFILALVYNCLHSIALYYQVITLNVAVNSYSNALLTLLLSNQFVEIKSTVFKRFDKDNLFQLTCADIVERFHLWVMLLIIGMRNIVEVGAFSVPGAGFDSTHDDGSSAVPLHPPSILPHSFTVLPSWLKSGEALSPFLIVVGSEMLVDAIKHAYVTKFNNIKPNFYGRTLDILCKDYYTNAFVTPSLTRRLGLAVIPLSCLFIRASIQTYHMFLATHVPMPVPPSTQTSLSEESAVPSSPAMIAALSRFDALIRDSLGRATYGYPYGSPLNSRPWYSWTSDDLIAALTMVVVFFIAFLVLLILKLLLGMVLLQYSRNRYAKMKHKETMVAMGKAERESYDAAGRRVGGRGDVEVTDDKARWIHADKSEGLRNGKGPGGNKGDGDGGGGNKPDGDYMGVARYEMVAKRIW
ncbi:Membrane protein,Tapt1/CMV receptor [Metarhizium album ARSEF 1941]|uniref:Membrane protein,Tapt1/CMV receptor n=1 Tax=Metarhizium album (strain ARSEF 1941) TaxID=1081103 RepID=A0A0B2WPJ1_METAS|nr:Membrane protein,Tapt1/CMV receptor [Metarhizium album ARSEF 1941]KHN95933.1 Membrane protein,Tapt1/CMV receptor [Metarhizium album ARSEF 1941]